MTSEPTTRPRLLIVAGPNGAGKTTVTDAGLAHQWFAGCEYINPDLIAQRELGDWNDTFASASIIGASAGAGGMSSASDSATPHGRQTRAMVLGQRQRHWLCSTQHP